MNERRPEPGMTCIHGITGSSLCCIFQRHLSDEIHEIPEVSPEVEVMRSIQPNIPPHGQQIWVRLNLVTLLTG